MFYDIWNIIVLFYFIKALILKFNTKLKAGLYLFSERK